MKTKEEKALEYFKSGLNCAQSVFTSYAEEFNINPELASSISCGFGGGMGRLQETCGAVTGAFMVLGMHNCRKYTDIKERKEKTYSMVRDFSEKFISLNGTLKCRELINCDLQTKEGRQYARDNNVYEEICEKCVSDSLRIVNELIGC
jgi:C_GCAxxG_C_C family probable redox protein